MESRASVSGRVDVEYWVEGTRIAGWLYLPAPDRQPAPALVFCPGYTGTRFAAFYQPYVRRFTDAGWAVLLSDYRGWGDSDGERGRIVPLEQIADLQAGLTFLQTRPEVNVHRLAVLGVSFGGGHATWLAALDSRVRAGVAISAVADGGDWLRSMRREYEWQDFLDELEQERRRTVLGAAPRRVHPNEGIQIATPERRATQVKGSVDPAKVPDSAPLLCAQAIIDYSPRRVADTARAMLWICVARDSVVPPEHSYSLFKRAPEPKRLIVLPGRGHYSAYVEHELAIGEAAVEWLSEHCARAT